MFEDAIGQVLYQVAQAERERVARECAAREQAAREQAVREHMARMEQQAREHAARMEQQAREQAAREQAAREQTAREEEARGIRFKDLSDQGFDEMKAGNYAVALTKFDAAIGIDATKAIGYINKTKALNALGQYTVSIGTIEEASRHHPNDVEIQLADELKLIAEGLRLYDTHDYRGASARFEAAIVIDATKAIGYINWAKALNELHEYDNAMLIARMAERPECNPTDAERLTINRIKCNVLHSQGVELFNNVDNYANAILKFNEVLIIDGGHVGAKANKANTEGMISYNAGDYGLALAKFNAVIVIDANHVSAKASKVSAEGMILYITGNYPNAILKFNEVLAIDANHLSAKANKASAEGIIFYNAGKYRKAIVKFNEALVLDARHVDVRAGMASAEGMILYNAGNHDPALGKFDDAIAIDDTKAINYIKKAETLNKLNRVDEALKAAAEAVRLDPVAVVNEIQAFAYNGQGDRVFEQANAQAHYQQALQLYDQAVRLVPTNAKYLIDKAKALNATNDYDGAIGTIISVATDERAPTAETQEANVIHAIALNGLGNRHKGQKRYEEAKIKYSEAGNLDHNQPLYRQNLEEMNRKIEEIAEAADLFSQGKASFDQGKYKEAFDFIKQAIDSDDDKPTYHRLKARIEPWFVATTIFEEGCGLLEKHRYDEAPAVFKRIDAAFLRPEDKLLITKLEDGNKAFVAGSYAKALKFYVESRGFNNNAEFFEGKAVELLKARCYEGAIEFAKKALEIDQDSVGAQGVVFESFKELIKVELEQKKHDTATKLLAKAKPILQEDSDYFKELEELVSNPGGKYKDALELLKGEPDGNFKDEEGFKKYLTTIPPQNYEIQIKAHHEYAMKLFSKEKYPDSLNEHSDVLKVFNSLLGDQAAASGKQVGGITKAMVLSNLGWVSMELGIEHMKVIKHFTEALKLNKELEEAKVGISIAYNRHGEALLEKNPRDALDAFTKAFGYHKDDIYQANLGLAYMGLKAYGQALDCFKGIKEGSFEYVRVFLKKEEAEEAKTLEQEKLKADQLAEQEEKILASITTKKTQGKSKEDINKLYDDLIELADGTKKSLEYVTKKVKHTDDGQSIHLLVGSIKNALHLDPHYMPALGAIAKCYPDSPELAGVDAAAASAAYDSLT